MHVDSVLLLKSLGTGFIVGAIFSFLRLPIPAPSELAGIVGIIGIFLGFAIVRTFVH